MQSPLGYFAERRMMLDRLQERLCGALARRTLTARERFSRLSAALDAMSPLKVLARGYAISMTDSGRIVRKTEDVALGDKLTMQVQDGKIRCTVDEIERRK